MSVLYYRQLLTQTTRIEAFRRALETVVRPDDFVLEIGAGLGTYSFFAADAGARVVWGVDADPIIHVAKVIGKLNGYQDRVTFVRGLVPQVEPPALCDLVIFEDFPTQLIDTPTFRLYRDVHRRLAAPGVRAVPQRAVLYLAPVRSAAVRTGALGADADEREKRCGIDFSASREYAANLPCVVSLSPTALVAEPAPVGEVWFDRPPDAGELSGGATWHLADAGRVDGLVCWFDLELAPEQWLSNAPGSDPGSWGQLFLPLDPVLYVIAGQALRGEVGRDLAADGAPTWLSWTAEAQGDRRQGHEFASVPSGFQDLLPYVPEATPVLSAAGELDRLVLQLTDGSRTIDQIVGEMCARNPELDRVAAEEVVGQALWARVVPALGSVGQSGSKQ